MCAHVIFGLANCASVSPSLTFLSPGLKLICLTELIITDNNDPRCRRLSSYDLVEDTNVYIVIIIRFVEEFYMFIRAVKQLFILIAC